MRCLLLVFTLVASTTIARPLPYIYDPVSAQDLTYGNTDFELAGFVNPNRDRGGDYPGEWNRPTLDGQYLWPDGKFRTQPPPHGPHTVPGLTNSNGDGSTSTTNHDGTITTPRPNGSIDTLYPDGTLVTKKQNGKVRTRYPDGTVTDENDDGTVTIKNNDGTTTTRGRDGKETTDDS